MKINFTVVLVLVSFVGCKTPTSTQHSTELKAISKSLDEIYGKYTGTAYYDGKQDNTWGGFGKAKTCEVTFARASHVEDTDAAFPPTHPAEVTLSHPELKGGPLKIQFEESKLLADPDNDGIVLINFDIGGGRAETLELTRHKNNELFAFRRKFTPVFGQEHAYDCINLVKSPK